MKIILKYRLLLIPVCALLILLQSCDRDNNHPGYAYYPDMTNSRAYESYSENPNFGNGITLREPLEGTVPRGYTPLPYTIRPEDRFQAGLDLTNPIELSEKSLERGAVLFERFCIHCHGEKGDGQGFLYTENLYPYPPASLVNDKVKELPDGEIFHTITYGYGVMGTHGSMIRPEDRWKIVSYIREELQKEN